ncbi:MAG: nucleotidyltransferase domain-containing protein [Halobacteriota archaeon]
MIKVHDHVLYDLDMPPEDRELIIRFVDAIRTWAPRSLTSITLYGSLAHGFFPDNYDIDIVVVFSTDFNHPQFYTEVYRIIKALSPHRKMHVVLKWDSEIEPAYRKLIDRGFTIYP